MNAEERVRSEVTAFCPVCHRENPGRPLDLVERCPGELVDADGGVWLRRSCRVHGTVVTRYEENAMILDYLEQWTAPPGPATPDDPTNTAALPGGYCSGLGAGQRQHTCILLEDVTETCNLSCPTCYAGSSPRSNGSVEVADVLANVDKRLAREGGRLDVLMISGGEPTMHLGLLEILEGALQRDIVRVLVNTNGIAIAADDDLLRFLADRSDRIEVYLQFDGFEEQTHRRLRGADLRAVKERAVRRLSAAGVFTTLTMTAALGVNDHEIGRVVRHTLDTPFVGGVCIQPVFGSGRGDAIDPLCRLTHTGVLGRLGPQTDGVVTWRDLIALPCSHPHCSSVGYMIRRDGGEWQSVVSMVGHDRLLRHLGLVANRVVDRGLGDRLRLLLGWAGAGVLGEPPPADRSRLAMLVNDVAAHRDVGLSTLLHAAGAGLRRGHRSRRAVARRIKRITVKPFMDIDTMIEERLLQCCVHVGAIAGGRHHAMPFCAAQAWPQLAALKPSRRALAGIDTGD